MTKLLIALFLALPAYATPPAQPDIVNQRIWFVDGWSGETFQSFYSTATDEFRLDACDRKGACTTVVAHMSLATAHAHEADLKLAFDNLLDVAIARADRLPWSLMGGADASDTVKTLRQIEKDYQTNGIDSLIYETDATKQTMPPEISDGEVTKELIEQIGKVFAQ